MSGLIFMSRRIYIVVAGKVGPIIARGCSGKSTGKVVPEQVKSSKHSRVGGMKLG